MPTAGRGVRPIPGRKAHGRSRISNGRDIDGRSIVARSYRDIANAILVDQSGAADHGEAAQGHQPTWLLPRAVREHMDTLLR